MTFTSGDGQRGWLAEAEPYGGHYLVGTNWVVVANEAELLTTAQIRLGGEVQQGAQHGRH